MVSVPQLVLNFNALVSETFKDQHVLNKIHVNQILVKIMDVVWLMEMVSYANVHQDILVQDVKYVILAHQIHA